jgi:hypothetical protein
MRIGNNPHKDQFIEKSDYLHQIIIPVFIPHFEGYFKDSLVILKLCLQSLFNTVHNKTFITIVNNGSCNEIKNYLDELHNNKKIHEIIHTENIGKLNAILKGLAGNAIELVTISDADVLFLPNWQSQTVEVFNTIPRVGVVGIVPQFKMYESNCGNIIFDNLFNNKLQCIPVKNPHGLIRFYESIGWDTNYNQDYLKYGLGYKVDEVTVYVGSGHFVATYKKDMFQEITSFIGYKMGGISEKYLDIAPLNKGYWRVTTYDNYAFHMGNTLEDWMKSESDVTNEKDCFPSGFSKNKKINPIVYFIKNRLFVKFISIKWMVKLFLKWKNLPKGMIEKY